jgi:hypothetical protein
VRTVRATGAATGELEQVRLRAVGRALADGPFEPTCDANEGDGFELLEARGLRQGNRCRLELKVVGEPEDIPTVGVVTRWREATVTIELVSDAGEPLGSSVHIIAKTLGPPWQLIVETTTPEPIGLATLTCGEVRW